MFRWRISKWKPSSDEHERKKYMNICYYRKLIVDYIHIQDVEEEPKPDIMHLINYYKKANARSNLLKELEG